MNTHYNHSELRRHPLAIGVRENEGGAPAPDTHDLQYYGRRIEADRSWTVYHVFTGIPARVRGRTMTDLSRSEATDCMLSLNQRNAPPRKERGGLPSPSSMPIEAACQP
jgi:hypothetical protein